LGDSASMKEHKEDFATLFEESYQDTKRLEPGQLVETTIVSISKEYAFLQLGGKSEGVIELEEFTNKEGEVSIKVGDTIKAFFLHAQEGELLFTTRVSSEKAGLAVLENAFDNEIPVEGLVEKEIKGGFQIRLGELRAFCPYSKMDRSRVEDAASYIGKRFSFKIIDHSEGGRNILLSRRDLLEEEHQKQLEVLKKTWKENMVVQGEIKRLEDYGAFVDIGGIQALLPVSEISRSRVEDIHQKLKLGQRIEASLIKIDWSTERLTLSMKALQKNPWDTAKQRYPVGSKHEGSVVRILDFGAFVALEPGLDGLIHVSDMKSELRNPSPSQVFKVGQKITVQIQSLDAQKQKISLKEASSFQEAAEIEKYSESEEETYNPFAQLLQKKPKK